MSEEGATAFGCFVLIAIGAVVGFLCGSYCERSVSNELWHKTLVERGVAHWEIVDDTGKTEWKWNVEPAAEATGEVQR